MMTVYFPIISATMAHPNQKGKIKLKGGAPIHKYGFIHLLICGVKL